MSCTVHMDSSHYLNEHIYEVYRGKDHEKQQGPHMILEGTSNPPQCTQYQESRW